MRLPAALGQLGQRGVMAPELLSTARGQRVRHVSSNGGSTPRPTSDCPVLLQALTGVTSEWARHSALEVPARVKSALTCASATVCGGWASGREATGAQRALISTPVTVVVKLNGHKRRSGVKLIGDFCRGGASAEPSFAPLLVFSTDSTQRAMSASHRAAT